jgi:hypothetical protein
MAITPKARMTNPVDRADQPATGQGAPDAQHANRPDRRGNRETD